VDSLIEVIGFFIVTRVVLGTTDMVAGHIHPPIRKWR